MATVRNRSSAQLMLPRDENADAVGKLSSKGGGLGGKGLQQQQAKSVDRPRKLLGDITNVKSVQPPSASKVEAPKPSSSNPVIGGNENAGKDGGKPLSTAKPARVPLRNITNARQQLNGAPSKEAGSSAKHKVPALASQAGAANVGPKTEQAVGPENIDVKIQRWAQEGIERVHFTADDMDALKQKIQNEETEKRVAKVLAYKTDFPRVWKPITELAELKPSDVLVLDHIPDRQFHSCASSDDDEPMELTTLDSEDEYADNNTRDDVLASHLNWNAINLSVRPF